MSMKLVAGILAFPQRIEQHAETVIHIADIRQIGALRLFVQVGLVNPREKPIPGLKIGLPSLRTISSRSSRKISTGMIFSSG